MGSLGRLCYYVHTAAAGCGKRRESSVGPENEIVMLRCGGGGGGGGGEVTPGTHGFTVEPRGAVVGLNR